MSTTMETFRRLYHTAPSINEIDPNSLQLFQYIVAHTSELRLSRSNTAKMGIRTKKINLSARHLLVGGPRTEE